MGLDDLFKAFPKSNPDKQSRPGEAPLNQQKVNELLDIVKRYRDTGKATEESIHAAVNFGNWSNTLPDPTQRGEYEAVAREYYRTELKLESTQGEQKKAA